MRSNRFQDIVYPRGILLILLCSVAFLFTGWIPTAQAAPVTGQYWYMANSSAFPGRFGHTSVVFNGGSGDAVWVIGGDDGGTLNNLLDVWYSPDEITWTQAPDFPAGRYGHASVVFDTKAWVIGGYDLNWLLPNDVWNSTDGLTWEQATVNAEFSPRYGLNAVVFNNGTGDAIWLIGGWDGSNVPFNEVWYSTDGITWNLATDPAFSFGRYLPATVVFNNGTGDAMWMTGGDADPGGTLGASNDVWYSTDGLTWYLATASAEFPPRAGHTSVVFDGMIWVFGGYDILGNPLNDAWYSSDGILWNQATGSAGFSPRYGHTSVVFDSRMWVIGGYDNYGSPGFSDVWYSPLPVPLTVTGIAPATGVNGSTVSITNLSGAGFLPGASVNLTMPGQENITASGVSIISPDQITCTFDLTGAAPGARDVVVTNPDGDFSTLPGGFTVMAPPPEVSSISPSMGFNTGLITITNLAGNGFMDGATLNLTRAGQPNITATNVSVVSSTQITCTFDLFGVTPGLYNITLTNPDGQFSTLTDGFSVIAPPPVVLNITPATGFNLGLTYVTLDGTGFLSGAWVKLTLTGQPSINATNVSVVSATRITCDFDLTGAAAGNWVLIVTNPDGQASQGPNNIWQFVIIGTQSIVNQPSQASAPQGGSGVGYSSNSIQSSSTVAPYIPPPELPTSTVIGDLHINAEGITIHEAKIQSVDTFASVLIPININAKSPSGTPLTSMSITPVPESSMPSDVSGSLFTFTGRSYEIGPDGATFSPAVTLSFTVPKTQTLQTFTIRWYDRATNTWQNLPTTYNSETGTATTELSHLCLFALFGQAIVTPPPTSMTIVPTLKPTALPTVPPKTSMGMLWGGITWGIDQVQHFPLVLSAIVLLIIGIFLYRRKRQQDQLKRWRYRLIKKP